MNAPQYFDHEADIGIIGCGNTIIEAFVSAAEAMFSIMTDRDALEERSTIQIDFEEDDVELAFVTWLNLLIAHARCNGLVLKSFRLIRDDDHWVGEAKGEPWRDDLVHGTEVKGATLTALSVKKVDDHWEARCVVDV